MNGHQLTALQELLAKARDSQRVHVSRDMAGDEGLHVESLPGANLTEEATSMMKAAGEASSTATVSASSKATIDRMGTKGNPMIWSMSVTYGSLTVLAILVYIVWGDVRPHRSEKPKPNAGLPAGYQE